MELARALEELKECKIKLAIFKLEKDSEISELIAKHKLELTSANETRDDAGTEQNNQVMVTLKEKDEKIESLKYEIEDLKRQRDELENRLIEMAGKEKNILTENMPSEEDQTISLFKRTLNQSREEYNSTKKELEKVKKELRYSKRQFNVLENQHTFLLSEIDSLKIENSEKIDKIAKLASDLENMQEKYRPMFTDLLLKDNELKKLRQAVQMHEKNCERIQMVIDKLVEKNAAQKVKISKLTKNKKNANVFEPLTVDEMTKLHLHNVHCKYSKHKSSNKKDKSSVKQ